MGQKSNLLTLQKEQKLLNLQTQTPKLFVQGFTFLNNFERLLNKKNIILADTELNFESNKLFLNISVFFCAIKTSFYRKKVFLNKKADSKNLHQIQNLQLKTLLSKEFSSFNNNLFSISIVNLNNFLDKNILTLFYKRLKNFVGVLFNRRFSLFIDFLKINTLFIQSKLPLNVYLNVLGQIFKILPKHKHNRFLLFLKIVFQTLILNSTSDSSNGNILGIKLLINGRLKGKPRSNLTCIQVGSTPIQSLSKNVDFAKTHVYTLNGVFGFKIWVYKK